MKRYLKYTAISVLLILAILESTIARTTYTFGIGETLGNYTLTDIEPKRVTLEKDRRKPLNLTPFRE